MNMLRKILFVIFAAAGLTLGVSAQKNDPPKRPPKDPPKVEPKEKPPREKPQEDKKPKKPGMAYVVVVDLRKYGVA